jgi:hypothetical protein
VGWLVRLGLAVPLVRFYFVHNVRELLFLFHLCLLCCCCRLFLFGPVVGPPTNVKQEEVEQRSFTPEAFAEGVPGVLEEDEGRCVVGWMKVFNLRNSDKSRRRPLIGMWWQIDCDGRGVTSNGRVGTANVRWVEETHLCCTR